MGRLTLAIGAFIFGGASLFAGPENGTVVHGHAKVQYIANGIEIHSGHKTIINWDSFSIDPGEIVRFCQNSSASAVLNRVIGSEQSLIHGQLSSNGHVFLLNQNGILIGKNGKIDAAGFMASTLDLSNDQFLNGGGFLFKGDGKGSVINLGTIHTRGGDVFLIGYHVSNEGSIQTDGGVAGLASGGEVFISVEGEERLYIRKGIDSEDVGASNDGVIRAAEVEIKASANPFALAIKHGGEIQATAVAHKNGRVLLVADSGKTEVAGFVQAESGTVHVLGDEVTLTETASIDVSGDVGGVVLVGGDYQGANPDIQNSRRTYIYKGAEVCADGLHGDAGKVIFWGDETTHFFGDVSAAAFGEMGDGGFVEVSAKSNDYVFQGLVNASSVNGAKGMLLLDPPRIRVRLIASNPPFPQGGPNTYMPTFPPATANLNPSDFTPILAGGTNVTINSTSPGIGTGTIDFETSFNWAGPGILNATAFRNINVTGGTTLQATNGGGFNFVAQGNGTGSLSGITINGSLNTTTGPITLNGTSTTGGGSSIVGVSITGVVGTTSGPISITGGSRGTVTNCHGISVTGGAVSVTGGVGGITMNGTGSASGTGFTRGVSLTGGTVSSVGGLINITGTAGTGTNENQGIWIGSVSVTSDSGGITMNGTGNGTGSSNCGIKITDNGLIQSISSGDINLTGLSTTGTSFDTDGIILVAGAKVLSEGFGNIIMDGTGQAPGIGVGELSGIDIIGATVQATGAGTITLTGLCDANSEFSEGVKLKSGTLISSTNGKITITGTNHSNQKASYGFAFEVPSSAIIQTTNGGNIEISGTSTLGITTSRGFYMPTGTISTTGSGSIDITGDIASGTGTTGQNGVEIVGASTSVSSVNGDVTIIGRSGGTSGSSYGVRLTNSATVQSTGSGDVTLNGTSRATGGSSNFGVLLAGGSVFSSGSGVVTIIGSGGMGTANNHGVAFPTPANATVTSPGGLVLTGTSQDGSNSYGVLIPFGATALTTGAGDISINGNAIGSDSGNTAVYIRGEVDSQGSGGVTIEGTTAATVGTDSKAVFLDGTGGGGRVSAVDGLITFTGTSHGSTTDQDGVLLISATVSSTGLGVGPGIVFNGQASSGNNNDAIDVRTNSVVSTVNRDISFIGEMVVPHNNDGSGIQIISGSSVTSTTGNISLTGTGSSEGIHITDGTVSTGASGMLTIHGTAGTFGNSRGTRIEGSSIANANGLLSIFGTGSTGGGETQGIYITGVSSVSTSGTGNIFLDGTGGAGSNGYGIEIEDSSIVSATGTGILSATGTAGSGSGNVYGIYLTDVGTAATTVGGSLTLTGTGGTGGGGSHNVGVFFENSAMVSSTSGIVTLEGHGGGGTSLNHGIELVSSGNLSSGGGLVFDGTSANGTDSRAVLIASGITAQTTGAGAITILGITSADDGSPAIEIGGTVQATGTGGVGINGQSTGSDQDSPGVYVPSGIITTNGGNIAITGIGNTGANLSEGISLNAASISASGGIIQLIGSGNDTSGSPAGIAVAGGSSIGTTGTGTMTLTTAAGDFTDSGGSANTYNTQQGAFTLTSAGGVLFSGGATSTITTTLGSATLTAQNGDIQLGDSGSVTTGGGNASLSATDHVRLGVVNVTPTADIVITAGGQVSDNTAALVQLVGNRGYISSGETGPISTTLSQFQGETLSSALGNESITLTNSQALDLISWHMALDNAIETADNGSVSIVTTTGGITVINDVVAGGSGLIGLNAASGGGPILVLEDVTSTSGTITLLGSSVVHTVNGNLATGGVGEIAVTAQSGNITMNPGTSYTTGGGNATLLASNSAALNLINVGTGDISVTATAGTISNNSGANSPAILVGNQGTLHSALGAGSGTSSDTTAIGTDLATLIGSVTGGSGGIIIFEQSGLSLGNVTAPNGTVDINANNLIQQIGGNPTLTATDAVFTTRSATIGTADVVNGGSLILNASTVGGNLDIDVGANTLTLGGNSEVVGDYTVTAGTYDENGFTVTVGGTSMTPATTPLNVITASGAAVNFDLSSATLASSGNITVNLRGGFYSGTPIPAPAIQINSSNNTISNSLTLTTFSNGLVFQAQDYNLVNSAAIILSPMQHFIVNAAKGANFTPGIVNPKSSPYDNSTLNGGNGSLVTITNGVGSNTFQGWVSIRDSYTTEFEAGSNLSTEYVNTYGDLTIRSTGGAIMTGATGETMRCAGSLLTIESDGNISVAGMVSNLTVAGALNGILSYSSTGSGSISGPALSQASQVKLDFVAGGIGTGGQDLLLNTPEVVFTAANDVLVELNGGATVAGNSTAGAINLETSGAGDITIDALTIDGLNRIGLTSAGANGIQVAAPATGNSVVVNQAVSAANGPIQLSATGSILHTANGDLTTTGAGTITVNALLGNLTMVNGTVYTTNNQFATLLASNSVQLGQVTTGTGNILVTASGGNITAVGAGPNLVGGNGFCSAVTGVGTIGTPISSALSQFQGIVSGIGDLYLNDTIGTLQLTNWNGGTNSVVTTGSDIDIQAVGDLTIVAPVIAAAAGIINLESTAGSVIANSSVTSNTGNITITGATNVTHAAAGNVTVSSGAGAVSETAITGSISMTAPSAIMTQGGAATLTAGTNAIVSSVNVLGGDIIVTGTAGTITRVGSAPDLLGNRVYCASGTGIGTLGAPIRSTLTEFQGSVTGTGVLALQETNTINLTNWNVPGNSVETNDGVIQIQAQAGDLTVTNPVVSGAGSTNLTLTATAGSIINGSGANSPEILSANVATLTAATGIGSGLATGPTAIGTNITQLIASVTGVGDVVIFEQSALDLGAITLNNGTLDIDANGLIQQIAGDPVLSVANASFTTSRNNSIGTAGIQNGGSLTLNGSVLAGSLSIDVGANTLTLGGNSEVGIDYTVTAATYDVNGFTVNVGGMTSTPPPIGGSGIITASGVGPDFDLSSAILPVANPTITINLRGGSYSATNPLMSDAILINSANNSIQSTLTLTTQDPGLVLNGQDYNLTNTAPISLNAGQELIINAARGSNFPALGKPNDSPFGGSTLNGNNGSNITLTNVGPNNSFPEWVSIRDPFNATFEAGPDLSVQYVNAYGDLQITAAAGAVTTGIGSQTVRTAGTNLRIDATGNIVVGNSVSNLTTGEALNGTLSYTTTGGSVQGSGLSQATNIKVSAASGGIGTGAQDLQLEAGTNVAFTAANNVFLDLSGPATIIGGDSTVGSIDIGTSAVGNVTIDTVAVDGLNRSGLNAAGASGIQVATPPGGSILVNQGVSATNAPIQLTANGAVTHTAPGDVSTTGAGTISVSANAGNLTMANGTVYITAGGNATLLASNSVQLARILTGAPGGSIRVTATNGSITKVGVLVNLVGNNAFCSAASGVGTAGTPILSTLSQFQGRVTNPGDLYLIDTTALQLTQWNMAGNSAETNSGLIDIQTQTGNLTVTNSVVAGGAGTINLDANAAAVLLNSGVSSGTGNITITGNTDVTHGASGNVMVTGAGGTVTETATTGNVTMDANSSITTISGNVTVQADHQIEVAAINAGTENIFLTATNQDISRAVGSPVNLIGGNGYAIAATGIGASGNALQSTLDEFQGEVTGTGDIFLFDTADGLQLTTWKGGTNSAQTNDGAIDIQTGAGTLTVVQPVVAGGAGTINLNANAANVLLSESVSSNTGSITITGSTNVTHQAAGNVAVTSGAVGTVTETAANGNVTMDGASSISTTGGNVTLNAGSSIDVSEINATSGNILMTATAGNISRVAGPAVNLIGANGFASAQTGVGTAGNILQSTLGQFRGVVGGTGGIFLNNTAALQLTIWNGGTNSVQTNSGAVDIQTAVGTLTVTNPVVAGGAGTINLNANDGVVAINQTVTSNTGSITVTGDSGVTHGMNGTVMVSSGAGGTVSETASTNDITMNGNAKIITQGGNITLLADNDLHVAEINTGTSGTITATATNGMIADTTAALFLPNFVSDEVILQANSGIGSGIPGPTSSTDIALIANFLTASTMSNDIVISELDGLTLRQITTQAGGNFFLEAGGLINQDGASTLQIDGNLTVVTDRASTLGTVHIVNSVDTNLAASEIAGNYTVDVTGNLDLSGDQYVGLDCNFNPTGTYNENGFKVYHGGDFFVNGVDPDLQGHVINATGLTPNFNLDLAMPFSADPVITVNLRGDVDSFSNPQLADAIILTQAGNTINGVIDIRTVDPLYQNTISNDYNLVQIATPFTLNAGQTLIINAARGTANPNVSGANGSHVVNSALNGGLGSNITLNLANVVNAGGIVSIRDPNLCTFNADGDPTFAHVNTYNNLTITAPSGSVTLGNGGNTVRTSGSLLNMTANQDINIGAGVNALTTAGVPFGEIVYTANSGSITGAGSSRAVGVAFNAPLGGVTSIAQTTNCIFNAMTAVDITNSSTAGNFGGTVTGPLTITQSSTGDLRVNSVTVNGVTRTGLTAVNQTVTLISGSAGITQVAGVVDAGTTGTVTLASITGTTGVGPDTTFQTLSRNVSATNVATGEIRIQNRLNGSNALSSSVMLSNGPGNADAGRNLFFSQVGGSSVNFQTINANGTGTLLAISGSANMNFSANVNVGGDVIAVANHNMDVAGVLFNQVTPNAVTTLVLDQESPVAPGTGTFTNAGMFNIASNNLAIYASSGPQAPANAVDIPPNQVILGSLSALETWDQALPNGLDSKYATSYSDGGSYHGPGFGSNYTPGNGVFGSQVIWYKFDVDQLPPVPGSSGRVVFDPRLGINAWEIDYLLYYWNENLRRLGYSSAPLMLIEQNFEANPPVYRPYKMAIDNLRAEVISQ